MDLVPFHHGNWSIRTLTIDGAPWFVAADVTGALGFSNGRKAVADHVADHHRGVTNGDTPGGTQALTIIDEAGMYALAFGSKLQAAVEFREWVTGEVLPEIRRTGAYGAAPSLPQMPTHAEALRGWADAIDRAGVAEARVAELEPAARFATTLAGAMGDYSVREAAGVLNRDPNISTGERRLFAVLRGLRWLDRTNQPYQGQVDNGRLVRKLGTYEDAKTGEMVAYTQVRITPKGLRFLHGHLGGVSTLVLAEAGAPS